MRTLLHIAYKGGSYRGWQRQKEITSIQEVLEACLEKLFGRFIHCMGCGRTDAGVHASQFFCHIDLEKIPDFDFIFRINKMLPDDIVVYELIPVKDSFHAQHSATIRTYDYFIHFDYDPFLSDLSFFHLEKDLDFLSMEKATALLIGGHDFKAFCKTPDVYKTTTCEIRHTALQFNKAGSILRFRISANRFLRNMVRLIVGNILEIGEGKLSLSKFEESLQKGTPLPYFKAAFPQGLYLSGVAYDEQEIPARGSQHSFFNFAE